MSLSKAAESLNKIFEKTSKVVDHQHACLFQSGKNVVHSPAVIKIQNTIPHSNKTYNMETILSIPINSVYSAQDLRPKTYTDESLSNFHPSTPAIKFPSNNSLVSFQPAKKSVVSVYQPPKESVVSVCQSLKHPVVSVFQPPKESVVSVYQPPYETLFPIIQDFWRPENIFNLNLEALQGLEFHDFIPLDPSKYKTELCRSYQVSGCCKYGMRCNYAHGLNQLKLAFRHGKYKTKNCQSYHKTGFCRYGARCSFIHDAEEGILKCPITDREVLEELHYRPMDEFQHIATITWRMLQSGCQPPTEVYFFTPMPGRTFSKKIMEEPLSKYLFKTQESTQNNDNDNSSDDELDKETQSSVSTQSHETSLTDESSVYSVDSTLEHSSIDKTLELTSQCSNKTELDEKIKQDTLTNDKNTSPLKDILASVPNQVIPISTRYHRNMRRLYYPTHRANNKLIKTPEPCSKFNLEEFLHCLKTQESKQQMSSRAIDMERIKPNIPPKVATSPENNIRKDNTTYPTKVYPAKKKVDLAKYKTELCRCYQYNQYCEYKESCLYAHGTKDLKSYPQHHLYRTKKCFSFYKKGFCLYGSRCQFLHNID